MKPGTLDEVIAAIEKNGEPWTIERMGEPLAVVMAPAVYDELKRRTGGEITVINDESDVLVEERWKCFYCADEFFVGQRVVFKAMGSSGYMEGFHADCAAAHANPREEQQ